MTPFCDPLGGGIQFIVTLVVPIKEDPLKVGAIPGARKLIIINMVKT